MCNSAAVGRSRPTLSFAPKEHPHYYCDMAALAVLMAGIELMSLTQEEQRRPGFWHWHILVERW